MIKIYIAGPITADNTVDAIENIRAFYIAQHKLNTLISGNEITTYNPAGGSVLGLIIGGYRYHDYFDANIEWLKVSDGVFLLPGWENSKGTLKEIKIASEIIEASALCGTSFRGEQD